MTSSSSETPKPAGPSRKVFNMIMTELKDLTPNVRELIIGNKSEDDFQFKAGQFIMLHVPVENAKPALRAYSIASDDRVKNKFRLLFKYVDQGVASTFVWKLNGSETLQFTGPFGRVFFKEPPTPRIVFLNTGTGLAQHASYLESKLEFFPQTEFHMLFGIRNEQEIYFEKELNILTQKFSNFKYDIVLSRPNPQWTGKVGYVQNHLSPFVDTLAQTPTSFYLCGNGGMIKEVKSILQNENFDMTHVHSEAFD
jgi:ferredoxin-NADP reductase